MEKRLPALGVGDIARRHSTLFCRPRNDLVVDVAEAKLLGHQASDLVAPGPCDPGDANHAVGQGVDVITEYATTSRRGGSVGRRDLKWRRAQYAGSISVADLRGGLSLLDEHLLTMEAESANGWQVTPELA